VQEIKAIDGTVELSKLADARPLRDNGFKVELAKRTMVAVLGELAQRRG
jgi:xanthine dehydrogenase YagS FAD-binding subunit